jgi:hypothetical protein
MVSFLSTGLRRYSTKAMGTADYKGDRGRFVRHAKSRKMGGIPEEDMCERALIGLASISSISILSARINRHDFSI